MEIKKTRMKRIFLVLVIAVTSVFSSKAEEGMLIPSLVKGI